MSPLFTSAVILFAVFNAAGLVLARRWTRFFVFYAVDLVLWASVAAATILTAEPGIPDSWPGHADAFGHEITESQAITFIFGVYWLVLLGVGAIVVWLLRMPWARRLADRLAQDAVQHDTTPATDDAELVPRAPVVFSACLLALAGWSFTRHDWLIGTACLFVVAVWFARAGRARLARA